MENTMWKKTTEEGYNAGLNHMIPTAMTDCGFLVGEPDDHNAERQPRYATFVKINGEFFESAAPITINEFDSLRISDVKADGPGLLRIPLRAAFPAGCLKTDSAGSP